MEPQEYARSFPLLQFSFSFSPLTERYEVAVKTRFHFFAELFSMIGALFAFFILINKAVTTAFSLISV